MGLPSYDSALRYLRGEPGGGSAVVVSVLGRAAIIAAGGVVAARASGATTPLGTLAAFAFGGALAIEAFVLIHASRELARAMPAEPATTTPAAVVPSVVVDFGRS